MNIRRLQPLLALTRAIYLPTIAVFLTCLNASSATGQPASWVGDTDGYGNWGDSSLWDPTVVPNNGGGNTYDVTIAHNPSPNSYFGPAVDIDVTIDNLTLIDFAVVNGAILGGPQGVGYSLTVLGTTALTVATPELGTGVIQAGNATFTLGTLTNYDSSTKTLMSGGIHAFSGIPSQPAVMQWHGADIVTNNGFISLNGVNANLRNQDNGANALANFATNNDYLRLDNGHVISTAGNFTNNGFIALYREDPAAPTTLFQVNGNLTNGSAISLSQGARLAVTGNIALNNQGLIDLGEIGTDNSYRIIANQFALAVGTTWSGSGSVSANLIDNSGTISPGHSANRPAANSTPFKGGPSSHTPATPITNGRINVVGGIILEDPSLLDMEIGGVDADTEFDQLTQQGGSGTTLGGTLHVSFIDGFESSIQNSDTFDILVSDQPLSGSFDNVPSGARLRTADGRGSFRVNYAGQNTVTLSDFLLPPQPSFALSRKVHGALVGDLDLPLTGAPGVEPRSGGASGLYQMIIGFPNPVIVSDATLSGTGMVDSFSVNSGTVTVNLSGVTNAQTIAVTLVGVDNGTNSGNVSVSMRVLLGDVNRNGSVNGTDVSQVKSQSGHAMGIGNFIDDVNGNGSINGTDVSIVKLQSGTGLPAQPAR